MKKRIHKTWLYPAERINGENAMEVGRRMHTWEFEDHFLISVIPRYNRLWEIAVFAGPEPYKKCIATHTYAPSALEIRSLVRLFSRMSRL